MKKTVPVSKPTNCAIYTRKSTEEGLAQEFNSLDAQREAGEAYVASQRHEGWICLPTRYDDGGFSGGSMERPALQRLLTDVKSGAVQCIVVYKVDRLSRSLLDFSRIMETMDSHGCSFVSVTQHFNTTNSMGRLTLNILLSFAQFEREIIAERTRDKMGAARRKGRWVGGRPILGYDATPDGSRLLVNPVEAERVRSIFDLYLQRGSMTPVLHELKNRGWMMKQWVNRQGTVSGGKSFSKSSLHCLLTNPSYIGKIHFKGEEFAALHEALVDPAVYTRAQKLLRENSRTRGANVRYKHHSLLAGLLSCACCQCSMTHSYTKKKNRMYRYYVCVRALKEGWDQCPSKSLPAGEIETFVLDEIKQLGSNPAIQDAVIARFQERRAEDLTQLKQQADALQLESKRLHKDIQRSLGNGTSADALVLWEDKLRSNETQLQCTLAETNRLESNVPDVAVMRATMQTFSPVWEELTLYEQRQLLHQVLERVSYDGSTSSIQLIYRDDAFTHHHQSLEVVPCQSA